MLHKNSFLTTLFFLISLTSMSQSDCEVEVTFVWTLDSDWCESWCKIDDADGNLVAGYFSACQNQGCAACDIDDLYTWFGGDVDAVLENGIFVITQTELLPEGEYFVEMHDGYGDGWSDNSTEGIDAFSISGNINYSIDFTNGYLTTGYFTLSCEPGEGCTDVTACNYDSNAVEDDGSCLYFDDCGICDGEGIPNGECDCLGNVLDAVGECGGTCMEDVNGDGICDDCPGEVDECGICNGPGAIYDCGCEEMPDGDCDCNGNQLDALGICGGDCESDLNNNGVCDDLEIPGCIDPTACNYLSFATTDDGSCEYCSCITEEEYSLTIEASQPLEADGTTYRFYVNMTNDTDHLSAVFGDESMPMHVNTPEGAFNSEYNSSWNASGINPAFIAFFPELADDSYATIGLDVPALMSGVPGSENPALVEDTSQPITNYFMLDNSIALVSNSFSGASYFVTNGAENGLPDENDRVLIMQVTTTGDINGILNYQIFPEGIGANQIIKTVEFFGEGTWGQGLGTDVCGCTDSSACNYDSEAIYDDGSCLEFDECGVCDGPGAIYDCGCYDIPEGDCDCNGNQFDELGNCGGDCAADVDADGICDDVDDCVGVYDECGVCNGPGAIFECGCADIPEGDCDCNGNQFDELGNCGGDCEADADGDGICDDVDDCVGVYDECGVCNGPGAIYECGCADIPEEDCDCDGNQLDALGVCGGDCSADADADGICDDVDPCVGAYDECGICNGPGAIYECGCADIPEGDCDCIGNQLDALFICGGDCEADVDGDGICDDVDDCVGAFDECGICNGPGSIYDCGCYDIPEGDCDCNGNQLDALFICGGDCEADVDSDGICDDVDDCVGAFDECGICNGPGSIYDCGCYDIPEGDCDCNGNQLDALFICGGNCEADVDGDGICDDMDDCVGAFDECGVCNGPGAIYECGCADIPEGDCDCDGNQLDALFICGGDCEADADGDGICDDVDDCVGEYDECGVCNGPGAIYECGCADIPEGDCDCEGNQLDALFICGGDCEADADGDGICDDVDDCVGDYDECGVCNGPGAIYECGCADIPEGDCDCNGNQLDVLGECGGDCEEDADGDGVCDDEEILGCTDTQACNFNPEATEENGLCNYDCYGCIDPMACNFDEEATMDGGGCILPGEPCDDGIEYTEDDFLQEDCSCMGYGCTDPDACNYVEGAVSDNSMCNYVGAYSITGALNSFNNMIVDYSYPNTSGSTYEWTISFGDITNGEGTSEIEVVWWGETEGQLCVVETNSEGCSGDIACINVTITNGISEADLAQILIYPNPTSDILNVELNGSNLISVYDLTGRVVIQTFIREKGMIDVSGLQRGTYLIKSIGDYQSSTAKRFTVN